MLAMSRRGTAPVVGVVVLGSGLGLLASIVSGEWVLAAVTLSALGVTWCLLRGDALLPLIVSGGLAAVGILGVAWASWYAIPANLGDSVRSDIASNGDAVARIFMVASLSFLVGWLATRPRGRAAAQPVGTIAASERALWIAACCAFAVPVVLALGIGPGNLLRRPDYIVIGGPGLFVRVGTPLALPAVALAAFVAYSTRRPTTRIVASAAIVATAVITFSMGSRAFALIPLSALLGVLLVGRTARRRLMVLVVATAVLTVMLARIPIEARSQDSHGLLPYGSALLTGDLPVRLDPAGVAGSFLMSFPIATESLYGPTSMSGTSLWVSLSPAPSGSSGWGEVQESYRINQYTPYSGLAELGYHGLGAVVAYTAVAGLIFGLCERLVRRLGGAAGRAGRVLVIGVASYQLLLLLQYNLRSAARVMYLVVAAAAVAAFVLDERRARRPQVPTAARTAAL